MAKKCSSRFARTSSSAGPQPCADLLRSRIREHGPLTVAEFMAVALYHPELGYYTQAPRRSGRAGDFFTSVDAGPLFGELLARLFARLLEVAWSTDGGPGRPHPGFDLVEIGASDGRLACDVLDGLERYAPDLHARARVHLVETSAPARARHGETLGPQAARLVGSSADLPSTFSGIAYSNELLDAMPAHRVIGLETGLAEIYVDVDGTSFVTRVGPLSTSRLATCLDAVEVALGPGQVADISLAALDWVAEVGARLERGVLLLVDYGDSARALYSARHPGGTLRGFHRHLVDAPFDGAAPGSPPWLERPGQQDLTTSVDFTSITRAAEAAGLAQVAFVTQAQLLVAGGLAEALAGSGGRSLAAVRRRLAAQALVGPGGPGTTHKALLLAKGMTAGALDALAATLGPI